MQSEEGSSEGFGVHHPEFQADDTKFAVLNALAYIWDPLPTIQQQIYNMCCCRMMFLRLFRVHLVHVDRSEEKAILTDFLLSPCIYGFSEELRIFSFAFRGFSIE